MHNVKVADLMSTELITLERDESLDLADEVMRLARIRHLPVVEEGHLVGLVTHRDLLAAQLSTLAGYSRDEAAGVESVVPVADIMATDIFTVGPDTPALEAAKVMHERQFGCLPVVDSDGLVGILTEADFLELVIRAFELNDAEDRATAA